MFTALHVSRGTLQVSRDVLAWELADAGGVVAVVEVLNEAVELPGPFSGLIVQLVELGLGEVVLILGDVELAADFAGGGFGLAQVVDELAPGSAFEAFGAPTGGSAPSEARKCSPGRKYSWSEMFDMMLTAARWIWSRRPKSWEKAPVSVCSQIAFVNARAACQTRRPSKVSAIGYFVARSKWNVSRDALDVRRATFYVKRS